jgi:hypothetical protein
MAHKGGWLLAPVYCPLFDASSLRLSRRQACVTGLGHSTTSSTPPCRSSDTDFVVVVCPPPPHPAAATTTAHDTSNPRPRRRNTRSLIDHSPSRFGAPLPVVTPIQRVRRAIPPLRRLLQEGMAQPPAISSRTRIALDETWFRLVAAGRHLRRPVTCSSEPRHPNGRARRALRVRRLRR